MTVMIADDEGDFQRRPLLPPLLKGGMGGTVAAQLGMKEVSQHDKAAGAGFFQHEREPFQIGFMSGFGDGDAGEPEGGGFAEVGIGDEQGPLFRPPQAPAGKQGDLFTGEFNEERVWRHHLSGYEGDAAVSSCSAMRRTRSPQVSEETCP